jgi:predicted amidohydrolase YtcJ
MERILYNGAIYTLDSRFPRATAVAIRDDRVIAVGSDADMPVLPGAIRENLHGRAVLPGLTDAHVHWARYAESLREVDLDGVRTKDSALSKIAERARITPRGAWITGFGWSHDACGEAFPTARDLDSVAPDHPVYLRGRSGHNAWVNTLALRMAGLDRTTLDPVGAAFVRDESGDLTGMLLEWDAMARVSDLIPPLTIEQLADAMQDAQAVAHAMGVTGVHDFDDQPCLAALQVLRERGQLGLRVLKNVNIGYLDAALHMGLRFGFGDDWLRIGALKLFADGALGAHTAAMFAPYLDEPANFGIVVTDKETMIDAAIRATDGGLPTTIHAIGDRAVHDVLDTFERVRTHESERGIPRAARRHRVEHVQIIHPSDVDRLAQYDLIASMQPIHATSDWAMADRVWGAERVAWAYNPRLQLDRGVVVAFGSDAPYDHFGWIRGIHAAITRRRADGTPSPAGWTPAAKVTVDEAIRAYTLAPAYTAGMEDRLGRLAPGCLADVVVMDADPYALSPDEWLSMRVCGTMVGGVWRYGGVDGQLG